jgi:LPXTG-motif cell wall-anchored protein
VAPLLALTGVAVIVAGAGLVAVRRRHLLLPA